MFRSLLLFIFLCGQPLVAHQPDYFSHPQVCTLEESARALADHSLDMGWRLEDDSLFRFVASHNEVYFEISCVKGVFSCSLSSDGVETVNPVKSEPQSIDPDESSYLVAPRRVCDGATPQSLSVGELVHLIEDNQVIFYTGAGLSMASNLPDMALLERDLGIDAGVEELYDRLVHDPKGVCSRVRALHAAFTGSEPTRGHFAIKELAQRKNTRIVTENLDFLHEASGIIPYRVGADHLRDEIGPEAVSQINYIVCIGLSHDDRGFLGWYTLNNPQGKIVAIDLVCPSYLGDQDMIVIGDAQTILGQLL